MLAWVYMSLCVCVCGGGGACARAHTLFSPEIYMLVQGRGLLELHNYTNPPPLKLFNDVNMCKGKQEGTLSSNAHFALT